jgi:hypothetical protein
VVVVVLLLHLLPVDRVEKGEGVRNWMHGMVAWKLLDITTG